MSKIMDKAIFAFVILVFANGVAQCCISLRRPNAVSGITLRKEFDWGNINTCITYNYNDRKVCMNFEDYNYNERYDCPDGMVLDIMTSAPAKTVQCVCELRLMPRVYHVSQRRCYSLYSQGPCAEGRWLTIVGHNVICSSNDCYSPGDNTYMAMTANGTCAILGAECIGNRYPMRFSFGESGTLECSYAGFIPMIGRSRRCRRSEFLVGNTCKTLMTDVVERQDVDSVDDSV